MSSAAACDPADFDIVAAAAAAATAMDQILVDAAGAVRAKVAVDGKLSSAALDREQRATHGLAWLATYVEAVRQLAAYAGRMQAAGRFGETEALLVEIGLGEYLAQVAGGIPMSQGEIVRLADLGLEAHHAALTGEAVTTLIARGN
ncbi:MAG: acyl-CoA dehydrogenase, partial [Methylacidiphilales bacterium]|nr:acyl-CoA dehydrogenase [Candidatus Methylacidiphilales bacterium]